jgi:hypothetical protein
MVERFCTCDHPVYEEHEIYTELLAAKKTCSVPGYIPTDILDEFLPEFTTPITHIFNNAFIFHEWQRCSGRNLVSISKRFPIHRPKMISAVLV